MRNAGVLLAVLLATASLAPAAIVDGSVAADEYPYVAQDDVSEAGLEAGLDIDKIWLGLDDDYFYLGLETLAAFDRDGGQFSRIGETRFTTQFYAANNVDLLYQVDVVTTATDIFVTLSDANGEIPLGISDGMATIDGDLELSVSREKFGLNEDFWLYALLDGTDRQVDDDLDQFVTFVEVPEPATLGVLALGGLALLRRRRA